MEKREFTPRVSTSLVFRVVIVAGVALSLRGMPSNVEAQQQLPHLEVTGNHSRVNLEVSPTDAAKSLQIWDRDGFASYVDPVWSCYSEGCVAVVDLPQDTFGFDLSGSGEEVDTDGTHFWGNDDEEVTRREVIFAPIISR